MANIREDLPRVGASVASALFDSVFLAGRPRECGTRRSRTQKASRPALPAGPAIERNIAADAVGIKDFSVAARSRHVTIATRFAGRKSNELSPTKEGTSPLKVPARETLFMSAIYS